MFPLQNVCTFNLSRQIKIKNHHPLQKISISEFFKRHTTPTRCTNHSINCRQFCLPLCSAMLHFRYRLRLPTERNAAAKMSTFNHLSMAKSHLQRVEVSCKVSSASDRRQTNEMSLASCSVGRWHESIYRYVYLTAKSAQNDVRKLIYSNKVDMLWCGCTVTR